jgi:hypothetical protein
VAAAIQDRTQSGYATADFKLSKAVLMSVGFRPPQYVKSFYSYLGPGAWHNPQVTHGFDVSMSHGPSLPRAFSRTFAANHGTDLTTVFSGSVTWPYWDTKEDRGGSVCSSQRAPSRGRSSPSLCRTSAKRRRES